jgi:HK97 family phage prohead protease
MAKPFEVREARLPLPRQELDHVESLSHSAFEQVRKDANTDVRAPYDHDPAELLGPQSSGTLRRSVDSQGLAFELDLPDTTTHGRDARGLALRGDFTGASFGFIPGADQWSHVEGRHCAPYLGGATGRSVSGGPGRSDSTLVPLRSAAG